jgi:beta-alanine degradation protein BauB
MKLRTSVIVPSVVAAGAALLFLGDTASGQAPDAVAASPHLYTVRLENAYVRVLEYRSHPGDKEPMHSHRPGAVYYLSDFATRVTDASGRVTEQSRKAGDVVWRGPITHAAENIGKTNGHYLWVELKVPVTTP